MNRKQMTIAASDVRVGDELYDAGVYHKGHPWVRVVAVEVLGDDVRIETTNWHTTKHVREGIAVLRDDTEQRT